MRNRSSHQLKICREARYDGTSLSLSSGEVEAGTLLLGGQSGYIARLCLKNKSCCESSAVGASFTPVSAW